MSNTGLSVFDSTIQKSIIWINDLGTKLGWENRDDVFNAMRVTLHVLRDRVPPKEAVELGAQLPILLAGFFYENYRMIDTPTKERSKEAFLSKVGEEFQRHNLDADPEPVVKAVFETLTKHIDSGEAGDLADNFPELMRDLWPEMMRA